MTMPTSGNPISFSQLRTEFGLTGAVSAKDYATLNGLSSPGCYSPAASQNQSAPHAMSEWYDYNNFYNGCPANGTGTGITYCNPVDCPTGYVEDTNDGCCNTYRQCFPGQACP